VNPKFFVVLQPKPVAIPIADGTGRCLLGVADQDCLVSRVLANQSLLTNAQTGWKISKRREEARFISMCVMVDVSLAALREVGCGEDLSAFSELQLFKIPLAPKVATENAIGVYHLVIPTNFDPPSRLPAAF
jgi:hypothetical protein